ncbi:MAG: hypothetical protein UZ22_OP11002000741 [Microgenomates bacterium OLB23]|nr:MAG: hypothetical protein UZ22_OP11002000741 [Microgenomates bacterium OLB23]
MKAAHTIESSTGLNKKTGGILLLLGFILVALIAGYFLVGQVQNPAKRADEGEGISLSGPSCPADGFICRWDREPGVAYHYVIKDNAGSVVKEGDIPASSGTDKITVTHTPTAGTSYTCTVTAKNECGEVSDEATTMCSSSPQPSILPSFTPIPSITETPTPTPEATPLLSTTPTVTPSITLTPTKGPSPTATITPSPTDIVIVNTTNTPNPQQPTTKVTAKTTLPSTGGIPSVSALAIVLVGFAVVILGLVL